MNLTIFSDGCPTHFATFTVNDLEYDFKKQMFVLVGAPIAVNVLCEVLPESAEFHNEELFVRFKTIEEAKRFKIAFDNAMKLSKKMSLNSLD